MFIYPKKVGVFSFVVLTLILLTYRSFDKEYLFYVSWLSGISIVIFAYILFSYRLRFDYVIYNVLFLFYPLFSYEVVISPFSYNQTEHIKIFLVTTFYIISSSFLSSFIIKSDVDLKNTSFFILITWVLVNAIFLILFLSGVYVPGKVDFSGVFHDRNVFSITTLLVVSFSIFNFDNHSKLLKSIVLYGLVIISFGMILISKSITGLVGLVTMILLYSLTLSKYKKIIIYAIIFVFIVVILNTNNPLNARIDRFTIALTGNINSLRLNESAYLRVYLIQRGIELFLNNPIFGVGLNNAKYFYEWPMKDSGSFLHNTYLDILTSGGLILFLFYYVPIIYTLINLVRIRSKVKFKLNESHFNLWKFSISVLVLKLMYDITWTTYFEFYMVFTVVFAIYISFYLNSLVNANFKSNS